MAWDEVSSSRHACFDRHEFPGPAGPLVPLLCPIHDTYSSHTALFLLTSDLPC